MVVTLRVASEQTPHEGDQRDALQLGAALRFDGVFLVAKQRLEPVRVAQRFGGERRHHLAEADVGIGERLGVAVGAEENCPDDRALPPDGHDDDRAYVAHVERRLDALQRRVGHGVGDEHRLARIERSLELRIPLEVNDEVADRGVFVARDEPDLIVRARQEDRAAVEAERLPELAGDRLEDVDEVE